MARIEEDAVLSGCREVQNVLEFIRNSKRGIISGPRLRH
jgi:hypothetical protein